MCVFGFCTDQAVDDVKRGQIVAGPKMATLKTLAESDKKEEVRSRTSKQVCVEVCLSIVDVAVCMCVCVCVYV